MLSKVKFEKLLAQYDYAFPPELIAQAPAKPRDGAKLLIYDRKRGMVAHDTFKELGKYLPPKSLLVLNETKVLPARLELMKTTGGKVRVLYLGMKGKSIEALADRPLKEGEVLSLSKKISFTVAGKDGGHYFLQSNFPISSVISVFEKFGTAPIPPYIKHSPLKGKKLMGEYQTVFARVKGSVAAPTASLHFTKRLLASLKKQGIEVCFVTLHVGLGTFAPLTEENIKKGTLHTEWYDASYQSWEKIMRAKREGRAIIPVGTTALRTIESVAGPRTRAKHGAGLDKQSLSGETSLFIREGYKFKVADGLITNFHVPRSSLLMLVGALAGRENILAVYREAIEKKYRLFSFGDGMLIV